jgi:hypothetical protein
LAIDQDCAGAADAMLTANVCPCEPQIVAQEVCQRGSTVDHGVDGFAVDPGVYGIFQHAFNLP